MSNKAIAVLTVIALLVGGAAGFLWLYNHSMMNMHMNSNMSMNDNSSAPKSDTNMSGMAATPANISLSSHDYARNIVKPKDGQPIKKFKLVAMESNLEIKKGFSLPVWTYDGTVPSTEIRVTQGDFVQVEFKNELNEPVTIHWHGYPLLSAMDGIPGVTQDAVGLGETFTYEFSADVPGTYWYHSHQEGSKQVDKGLYGSLIVEPKVKPKIDKDCTLILDEWMENPSEGMDSMTGMSNKDNMAGMDNMGSTNNKSESDPVKNEEEMMSTAYNIYTVNAKSGELINPLEIKKGDVVRLRFINAGYRSHGIHIPGQDIKVVSTDGQDIEGAGNIKDQVILIAPGERYDVEFSVNTDDNFIIDAHDSNKYNDQIRIPVNIIGGSGKVMAESSKSILPMFDYTSYGKPGIGKFTLNQKYDLEYNAELNTRVDGSGLKYTISGKTFDESLPIIVNINDTVKLTFENKSIVDHPMHLHGHFFQILSRNGTPLTGAAIMKDTLLVKPGEKYTLAFKADNPGIWVEHCHELHHAAGGMMQEVIYNDYKSNYENNPNNKFNKPE